MHGAVDGFLMTVLFSVVRHVTVDNSQCGIMWSLTNLAVGLGQLTGLPVAGKKLPRNFIAVMYEVFFLLLLNIITQSENC